MRNIIIQVFLMTFTHQHEGYIIKVNKSKLMKYGVDGIIQKYLNPMRRLSEDLPNHNVEVQLEIVGSIPATPVVEPQRRHFRYLMQPHRRYYAEPRMGQPTPTTTTSPPEVTDPPTVPTTTTTTTMATTTATTNSGQRPVYMDDLKRALDDFERKFTTTQSTTTPTTHTTHITKNCDHQQFTFTRRPFLFNRPTTVLQYPIDRNINSLIKVLRSGVNLESPVARPTNENLEWFQVKIPKAT